MTDVLERQLAELSRRLDTTADERLLPGDVLARIAAQPGDGRVAARDRFNAGRRGRRVVVALAAVAAIVVAVVLSVPSSRHAVARWFGIGSTRIERTPSGAPTTVAGSVPSTSTPTAPSVTFPTSLGFGRPLSIDEAEQASGLEVPLAAELGAPSGIFVVHPPDSGQVVVAYPPSDVVPESDVAGVGALLSAVRGSTDEGGFLKTAASGTEVQSLRFYASDGAIVDAIWLGGEPHQLSFIDSSGVQVWDTLRLATNTLLWERDGVTYRLEADISRSEATRIASAIAVE